MKIQRGYRNPYIKEEQTTQWPKEKVQKDKQRSTKHTHETIDRVTRTSMKNGGELRCSGRVSNSSFTSGTRRVNIVNSSMGPLMLKIHVHVDQSRNKTETTVSIGDEWRVSMCDKSWVTDDTRGDLIHI